MQQENQLKYMDIYNHFLGLIRSGVLQPDSKLPTESKIAEQFQVSRITVIRALKQLQEEGYIRRIQGSGSYVEKRTASTNGLKIVSLIMSLHGQGREVQLIQGIEQKLKEAGYFLTVHNSHEDPETERNLILEMKKEAQGLILYPGSSIDNSRLFESLMIEHWPVVYVDRYPMSIPCSFVTCDNVDGGYQLGKFLCNRGHRQFAMVYHDIVGLSSERDRFNGFMKAISEHDIPHKNVKILSIDRIETEERVHRILDELFVNETDKARCPTAIFTFNDSLAILMMNCIRKRNKKDFPPQLTLAGFDDLIGFQRAVPFVTIRQDYLAIGEAAASLLLEKMESKSLVNRQIVIPVELIYYPA
ncbi:MAG: GntR family transcriptional regulator [Clostridia bacterium]|nr:GntR family transcriptional regulator [Clostridia bacterium]